MLLRFDVSSEHHCDECNLMFEISYQEEVEDEPLYCPFCGTELPEDELNFEDEENYDVE